MLNGLILRHMQIGDVLHVKNVWLYSFEREKKGDILVSVNRLERIQDSYGSLKCPQGRTIRNYRNILKEEYV